MQDIAILTSRAPEVYWHEGGRHVYLTFEGLRESRTIADKRTRIRVTLPLTVAAQLRGLLAQRIVDDQQ